MPPLTMALDPDLNLLLAREIIETRVAPAACVAVASRMGSVWRIWQGAAGQLASGTPTSADSLFDLASVTKPLTAATAICLHEKGRLDLTRPLSSFCPELEDSACAHTSLTQLLSHRGRLEPHIELFAPVRERRMFNAIDAVQRAAAGRRKSTEQPTAAVYSDLGYILAGVALERATHMPLDALILEQLQFLSSKVGSMRQLSKMGTSLARRVVPTEVVPWRGGQTRGAVHDENAWALAGYGSAGHAGMFGTAQGVAAFGIACVDAFVGRKSPIPQAVAQHMCRELPGGTLRTGFDGISARGSSAGSLASASSFGHLGFTGTSLWCDWEQDIVTVLLSNRVCPSRNNVAIRAARPKVHEGLYRRLRQADRTED